jgi:hypothetical protein
VHLHGRNRRSPHFKIFGVFLPTAFMLRQTILYRRSMVVGSALIAMMACTSLAKRSLDMTLVAA